MPERVFDKFILTIERMFYNSYHMENKRTIKTVERKIAEYFRESRRMPTYTEMMDILGVRSKSVVHFWIKKLLAMVFLKKIREAS
jgi:hypothetical protein